MTTETKARPISTEARSIRNSACPCGSGKKFKRCHLPQQSSLATQRRAMVDRLLEQPIIHTAAGTVVSSDLAPAVSVETISEGPLDGAAMDAAG